MTAGIKAGLFITNNFNNASAITGAFISAFQDASSYQNYDTAHFIQYKPSVSASIMDGEGVNVNSEVAIPNGAIDTSDYFANVLTTGVANTGTAYGYTAYNYMQYSGAAGSLANFVGFYSRGQMALANTALTNQYDFYADNFVYPANGTITNRYGLYLGFNNTGVTNAYGMYLGFNNTGVTNAYGIYQSSNTVKNYFAGNVCIGTASPSAPLHVNRSAPGTISSSGTTVTGTGTTFTTTFAVGDSIMSAGQTQTIATIPGDTSLTTSVAFSPVISAGAAYTRVGAVFNSVNVGIGTPTPGTALDVNGGVTMEPVTVTVTANNTVLATATGPISR